MFFVNKSYCGYNVERSFRITCRHRRRGSESQWAFVATQSVIVGTFSYCRNESFKIDWIIGS